MPTRKATLSIPPPSLDASAESLARAVQTSMASLYALQTALILKAPEGQKSALLSSFRNARQEFHNQCERINEFLQSCQTLAEHYAKLLEYTITEEEKQYLMFAENVETELQGLQAEMKSLISSQTQRKDALVKQKSGIANVLKVPVNKRKPSTFMGKPKTSAAKATPAPQTPDPERSFHDAFDALDVITSCLNDISSFWAIFSTEELSKIRNSKIVSGEKAVHPDRSPAPVSVRDNVQKWRAYHAPLSNAVFIISEASDAALVEPPVTGKGITQPVTEDPKQITGAANGAFVASSVGTTATATAAPKSVAPQTKNAGKVDPEPQHQQPKGTSKPGKLKALANMISSVLGKFGVGK